MKRLGFCALLFGALVSVIAAQSRTDGARADGTAPERAAASRPAAADRASARCATRNGADGVPPHPFRGRSRSARRRGDLREVLLRLPHRRPRQGQHRFRQADRADDAGRRRREGGHLGRRRGHAREPRHAAAGRRGRLPHRRRARLRRRLDPRVARRVRRAARRRPGPRHRPAPDERRVRLRDPRPHRRRHQDRHRRLERLGRRRGLRQLRRRAVVQDTAVEHYLEAAKQIADHAVIGSGPLAFYTDAGESGLELSALDRINQLYATKGFRVVSGEGGRPFGFERYAKAFYVAWHYKHRAALGDPAATVRGLAAKEGITGRFAEHIWEVVNRTGTGYPSARHDRGLAAVRGADGRHEGVDRQGAQRGRRPDQEAGDLAELVLRARRPRRGRRRRRERRCCSTTPR